MYNTKQFREVIQSTLKKFEELGGAKYSDDAVELLIMIAAHESGLGTYLYQVKGPALGVFQMEPATARDMYTNFISKKRTLDFAVSKFVPSLKSCFGTDFTECIATDLRYATVLARVFFMRFEEPIPKTPYDLAVYAKKYWNTELGKASVNDYLTAYKRALAWLQH
jgi:hypothetical protein